MQERTRNSDAIKVLPVCRGRRILTKVPDGRALYHNEQIMRLQQTDDQRRFMQIIR